MSYLLLYIISMPYIVAISSLVLVRERNKMIYPMTSRQCLSILFKVAIIYIIVIPSVFMAMPVNMFLVMYVILCILSHDFNKLAMLYIHAHILFL